MPRNRGITIQNYRPDQPIDWADLQLPSWSYQMRRFGRVGYQQVALALQNAHGTDPLSQTAEIMWGRTCHALSNVFARDSQYFQPDRFIAACQPGANVEEHLRQTP